jgi:hypothetical protein
MRGTKQGQALSAAERGRILSSVAIKPAVPLNSPNHSLPSGFGRHTLFASQPFDAPSIRSNIGMYGLISIRGVWSNTSTPSTSNTLLSLRMTFTIDIPIPFGRQGCLVANTPWASSSRKVGLINSTEPARSNWYKRYTSVNDSMSLRPAAYCSYPPHLQPHPPDGYRALKSRAFSPGYDCLICDFCSSGRDFACGFLQIPPRDGHPCRPANGSHHQGP